MRVKMSKLPPPAPTTMRNRPLPYYHPNCRTPRHWKFTQDHRTTRPPPSIWLIVGQGPTAVAVGAGCFDIFTLIFLLSPLSPSLLETVRYRLKFCLKGSLNPKQTNKQSINQA